MPEPWCQSDNDNWWVLWIYLTKAHASMQWGVIVALLDTYLQTGAYKAEYLCNFEKDQGQLATESELATTKSTSRVRRRHSVHVEPLGV